MTEPTPIRVGQILLGTFEVRKVLQETSRGGVYHAFDVKLRREVCVKVLPATPEQMKDPEALYQEARLAVALSNPYTIRILYCGDLPGHGPLFVMEWANGGSLGDLVKEAGGKLPLDRALAILRQVALSLQEGHDLGIVHRDIKPANVLICQYGSREPVAKVADYGIAGTAAELSASRQNTIAGTPPYMAPEIWRGDPIDHRVDLYAMAVMLFELLTGTHPFTGHDIPSYQNAHLRKPPPSLASRSIPAPPAIERALQRGMAKQPEQRPHSIRQWMEELGCPLDDGADAPYRARVDALVGDISVAPVSATPFDETLASESDLRAHTQDTTTLREQRPATLVLAVGEEGALIRWEDLVTGAGGLFLPGKPGERLAVFGYPLAQPDAPLIAVRTARRCGDDVRAAVHTQLLPLPGDEYLTPETLIKEDALDPVRKVLDSLLNQCELGDVLISTETYERVIGHYRNAVEDGIDALSGGKSARSLEGSEEVDWTPRTFATGDNPCVGQQNEREQLAAWIEEVLETSRPSRALVIGAPGLGKTRLRYELAKELAADGLDVRWVQAAAYPDEQGISYALVARLIRSLFDLPDGLSTEVVEEKLATSLAKTDVAGAVAVARDLASLVGVAGDAARGVLPDRAPDTSTLASALVDTLTALAKDDLRLICIEDLHWADDASLNLLRESWDALEEIPLALIGLARPELERHQAPWMEGAFLIRLSPLRSRIFRRLCRNLLQNVEDGEALIDHLLEHAAGVPLYAEETVRFWIQQKILMEVEGQWRLDEEKLHHVDLPGSLESLLISRIEALDGAQRTVVHAAAIVGGSFSRDDVSFLLTLQRLQDLDLVLNTLVQDGVLLRNEQEEDALYRFASGLLEDAAYANVVEEDRVAWHQRMAEWLESVARTQRSLSRAARAAGHWERAKDDQRALEAHVFCAELAQTTYAATDALYHLDAALKLADAVDLPPHRRVELHFQRGRAFEMLHRHEEALKDYKEGDMLLENAHWEDERDAIHWPAAIAYARSVLLSRKGEDKKAEDLVAAAWETLLNLPEKRENDLALLGRSGNWYGWCLARQEKDEEAAAIYAAALETLGSDGLEGHRSLLTLALAQAYSRLGRDSTVVRLLFEEGIAMKERLMEEKGEVRPLANAYGKYSEHLRLRKAWAQARNYLEKARALGEEHRLLQVQAGVQFNLGRVCIGEENGADAIRHFERAHRMATEGEMDWLTPQVVEALKNARDALKNETI